MARTMYSHDERRVQFLKAGVKLARKHGIDRLKLSHIANHCEVSPPLVSHVMGTREEMREAVKTHAQAQGQTLPESGIPVRVRK